MADPRRPDLRDECVEALDEHGQRLDERLRATWLEGADEDSRRSLGRGPTVEEFERVLPRYPGDV